MQFPPFCAELPVTDLQAALAYYRDRLGFHVDWTADDIGLACVSRDGPRMFLASEDYRDGFGIKGPARVWLNLADRGEVETVFAE